MYVLVINAGSSSLKYQIIDSETEELVTRGLCEKVGYSDAFVQHWNKNDKRVFEEPMENHLVAVKMVLDVLAKDPDSGIDQSRSDRCRWPPHRAWWREVQRVGGSSTIRLSPTSSFAPSLPRCTIHRQYSAFAPAARSCPMFRMSAYSIRRFIRPCRHVRTCMPFRTSSTSSSASENTAHTVPRIATLFSVLPRCSASSRGS